MAIVGKKYTSTGSTSTCLTGASYTTMVEYDTNKVLLIGSTSTGLQCAVAIPDASFNGFDTIGSYYQSSAPAIAQYIQAVAVSTTRVAISYKVSGTDYGYVVIASIAGTVVTFGTPINILAGYYSPMGIAKLDTDKCIVHYGNSTTSVNTTIITNVGTVASMSATPLSYSATSNAVLLGQHLIQAISSTQALVLYKGATKPCARVIDISGTTMTANAEVESSATIASGRTLCLSPVSSTKFVMGATLSATNYPNFAIVTVSGTTPTFGTYVATTSSAANLKMEIINSSYVICSTDTSDYIYLINISGAIPSIVYQRTSPPADDYTMIAFSDTRVIGLSPTGAITTMLIDALSTVETVTASRLMLEVGAGKQIEISSIYATWSSTNISINDVKVSDRLVITSTTNSPLLLPNSPIVLSAGDKLYVTSTGANVNMYGLERTV